MRKLYVIICLLLISSMVYAICCESLYDSKQYKLAVQECEKESLSGNSHAQELLGFMYYSGDGVKRDYAKAFSYFQKSANQGNSRALFALGGMYFAGDGVKQDYKQALILFKQAAERGDTDALVYIGVIYRSGYGVEVDNKIARQYLQRAADLGNEFAEHNLAQESLIHINGNRQLITNKTNDIIAVLIVIIVIAFFILAYFIAIKERHKINKKIEDLYMQNDIMSLTEKFIVKHRKIYSNVISLAIINNYFSKSLKDNLSLIGVNDSNYLKIKEDDFVNINSHCENDLTIFIKLCKSIIPDDNIITNINYTVLLILNKVSILLLANKFENQFADKSLGKCAFNDGDKLSNVISLFEGILNEFTESSFIENVPHYYIGFLINKNIINYSQCFEYYIKLKNIVTRYVEKLELNKFQESLLSEKDNMNVNFSGIKSSIINQPIDVIDIMNGYEFEDYIGTLFSKLGYSVTQTSLSGDQGVDIVAKKNDISLAIQTKRYSSRVGNSAVQQVVAGANYHRCNQKLIVTNNYFTQSAYELALANNVMLWDRDRLIEEITNAS